MVQKAYLLVGGRGAGVGHGTFLGIGFFHPPDPPPPSPSAQPPNPEPQNSLWCAKEARDAAEGRRRLDALHHLHLRGFGRGLGIP